MDALETDLAAQLAHTLQQTNFANLGTLYRGKVRDVYRQGDRLILVTTDRVSAFDVVLGTIPHKGQILNAMAKVGFETTQDIVKNHVLSIPDPNVVVATRCEAYPIEFVVRGYITGSLWRDYERGAAGAYGISLPSSLRKDQAFRAPILTPTTKAQHGHDQPISMAAIVEQGLMSAQALEEASAVALALFERGQAHAASHGLILVDTKYELGLDTEGTLRVIDEIHTPDCSRYWMADTYAERFERGEAQAMLDKENLRAWLIDTHGYRGDGPPPALTDEIRLLLTRRYMDAHLRLTGHAFKPEVQDVGARLAKNLENAGLFAS
ncbi:MAG: phosphoribosylaminoimidazolesuccinocarboxamide synthase [Deltaproteobacteria bacterium]|nr:phosphoribosylaminoimidazolesuccinocarboxamide synthase [Deltaproteobacteria bacterium]